MMLVTWVAKLWRKAEFSASPWAVFFNPYYIVRRNLYLEVRRNAPLAKGRVMDFGAGSIPYRNLFDCTEYVAVDIEGSGFRKDRKASSVFYDGRVLPFPDRSFDFVFSSEVLEHVFNVDEILSEIHRVMRPGAVILLSVPFVWVEHEQPHDFARYTSFGMRALLERHGFQVESNSKAGGFIETLAQMIVVYLNDLSWVSKVRALRVLMAVVVFAPVQLLGMALGAILPRNQTLYSNNVFLARKC